MRIIILFLLLSGCASTKNKVEEKAIEKTNIETKIVDTSKISVIEFVPVNDTLPFTINGQTFKNVKIRHEKRKNNISVEQVKKVVQKSKKAVKIKKQQINWLWLLLLIPIYYIYNKLHLNR